MSAKAILSASVSAGPAVYVEDVFSTFLYTGNSSTQTITNGIDLAGEGGLVWLKNRSSASTDHTFTDTVRGANKIIASNSSSAQQTGTWAVNSFNSSGFGLTGVDPYNNLSATNYCSWTFRKQRKFFDVVTFTGNGANRTIAHNLGSVPGAIWVKRTDTTGDWQCYHRSLANTQYMVLNSTAAVATDATRWNSTTPTSSVFSLGTDATVNASAGTYVAYVFAHDAGGFGDAGTDNVVKCGSFSGTGFVDLGWEPQFLLFKSTDSTSNWFMLDNMRGFNQNNGIVLYSNLTNSEADAVGSAFPPSATGFTNNAYTGSWIYIAIRRGPMKTPTVGTEVFNAIARTGTGSVATVQVGFAPDFLTTFYRSDPGQDKVVFDKLRGPTQYLNTAATTAEINVSTNGLVSFNNTSFTTNANGYANNSGSAFINHVFRRAPGFFDVVAYTGTGVFNHDVLHNLGVAPELIITKRRNAASTTGWFTSSKYYYDTDLWDRNGRLNDGTIGFSGGGVYGPDANITATQFRIASTAADINASGGTYIAYLFATCPGVSKCGSYTGTGTTLNVDCGFTAGARFVLIKRADAAGDWFVWDTARGIISGNDPYLLLNSSAAEVTGTDYIDPLSTGFQISSTAPAAINANGGTYIFLAIS